MKIIDCFTFFNEKELLLYRLTLLNEIVDHVVLVESTLTHKGLPKPLYYNELKNEPEFHRFSHKIIHIVDEDLTPDAAVDLSLFQGDDVWKNENHQRNSMERGLKTLELSDEDLIIISDADEIPDPRILLEIKLANYYIGCANMLMPLYCYNLKYVNKKPWTLGKMVNYDYYVKKLNRTPQKCRAPVLNHNHIECGWHLAYFNTAENISYKIKNFSHQEFNQPEFTNISYIEDCIKNKKDIFQRGCDEIVESEIDRLPLHYERFLSKYI